MSKTLQWIIGIGVVLIVASIIFSTVMPFFFPRAGGYGPGMMGPSMMGGYGMGTPFFGFGMITMLLWPVLFIGLLVLGAVWLVRSIGTPTAPPPPVAILSCAHCGKPLQPGWKACPYCGEKV